jgi:hypothetical protein
MPVVSAKHLSPGSSLAYGLLGPERWRDRSMGKEASSSCLKDLISVLEACVTSKLKGVLVNALS